MPPYPGGVAATFTEVENPLFPSRRLESTINNSFIERVFVNFDEKRITVISRVKNSNLFKEYFQGLGCDLDPENPNRCSAINQQQCRIMASVLLLNRFLEEKWYSFFLEMGKDGNFHQSS